MDCFERGGGGFRRNEVDFRFDYKQVAWWCVISRFV